MLSIVNCGMKITCLIVYVYIKHDLMYGKNAKLAEQETEILRCKTGIYQIPDNLTSILYKYL